jgi:hypothetical protein
LRGDINYSENFVENYTDPNYSENFVENYTGPSSFQFSTKFST